MTAVGWGTMVVVVIATDLDIRPISPVIGAEVHGLDLARPLGDAVVAQVRAALAHHLVLFFPDQDLSPEKQAEFARQFGEVTPAHPVIASLEGHPEVLPIDGREDRASWWHTDVTFLATPPLGSILHMREAPAVGGDTMWVSLQAAYDALSEPMRPVLRRPHRLAPRSLVRRRRRGQRGLRVGRQAPREAASHLAPGGPHPPRDGAQRPLRELAVHPFHRGLLPAREPALLDLLYRHCQRPEFGCRFRWKVGAVAFWDNRATLHYALDDYGDALRIAHRVTLRGPRPYGPARPLDASA